MTKGEIIFAGTIVGGLLLALAMSLGYNLYTNEQNRQAYQACLKTAERMAEAERSNSGVRIVSTPICMLR